MKDLKREYKAPDTLSFKLSPVAASRFRRYCQENNLIMSGVLEQAVVGILISKGVVESEESLRIEEALTK